jgi:hypothetical protein
VFFRGGYVGACVVEDEILSLAWVMLDQSVRTVGSGWQEQREYLARQSGRIGDLLVGAQPLIKRPVAVAAIPYGYLRRQSIAPNVYPVGDQLAVIPSFTGDGIAIALYSGVAAARAFLAGQQADIWQRQMIRRLQPQFRLAYGIGKLLETPLMRHKHSRGQLAPSLVRFCRRRHPIAGFEHGACRTVVPPSRRRAQVDGHEVSRKARAEGGEQMQPLGTRPDGALQDKQSRHRRHVAIAAQHVPGVSEVILSQTENILRRIQHPPATRVQEKTLELIEV